MKITILSSLPPIKGISKYTSGLLEGLSRNKNMEIEALGFKKIYPEFLYPGGTKDKSLKPVTLPKIEARSFLTWYNPVGWIYAGLTVKGEIIHAQWWSYILAPIYIIILSTAKFVRRKKIILTVHNVKPHEQGFIKNLANKSVCKLPNHFIVHSEDNKKQFSKIHKIQADKITVIPHGVLSPDTQTSLSQADARKKLNLPTDSQVILFFGLIRPYKGVDVLIDAFESVHNKFSKARLIIAGKSWEQWDKYQEIIDRKKLQPYIKCDLRFIQEDEIETFFKSSNVVVLPYKNFDSQSGAGSLALSFGKALIVTNVGGLTELVKNKDAVCPPNDPGILAGKILKIFNDKKLQNQLGNDSEELAKKLSWESIGKQTLDVYRKLIT